MIDAIGKVGIAAAPHAADAPSGADATKSARVHKAAQEFESMLVRQLLSSTKVAGKEGAYSGMAVDALANGVESGGGLGLARQIEEALSHTRPETK